MKPVSTDRKDLFKIRCLIRHPSAQLHTITYGMGHEPDISWEAGSQKKTPTGRKLDHKNTDTMWTRVFLFPGHRDFFACAKEVVDALIGKRDFITHLLETGGTIKVIIDVRGSGNSGGMLPVTLMNLISELGIELGLEVFP